MMANGAARLDAKAACPLRCAEASAHRCRLSFAVRLPITLYETRLFLGGLVMSPRIRVMLAALLATAVLVAGASPAVAYEPFAYEDVGIEGRTRETPVLLDAFFLRPMGLVLTGLGIVAFVPAAAFVGLTRPTDLGKPFKLLVANPFRYTFMDPLGEH